MCKFHSTMYSILFTLSYKYVCIYMHILNINIVCCLLVSFVFINNHREYTNLLNYFCLKMRNSFKKYTITFDHKQKNLSTEATWQLTDLKKQKTTKSLYMHMKSTKGTHSPILTHPRILIHLNSFVLKF